MRTEEDRVEFALETIRSVASLPSEDQRIIVERRVLREIFRTYQRKFNGDFLEPWGGPDEGKKALFDLAGSSQVRGMRQAFRFFLRRTDQNSKNIISPSDARNLLLLFQLTERGSESPYHFQALSSRRLSGNDAEEVLRGAIERLRRYEKEATSLLSKVPSDVRLRAKAHAYSHAADLLEDAILGIPLVDDDREVPL